VVAVTLDEPSGEAVRDLSLSAGARVACSEFGWAYLINDRGHSREWRHLDTMRLKTALRAHYAGENYPKNGRQTVRLLTEPIR